MLFKGTKDVPGGDFLQDRRCRGRDGTTRSPAAITPAISRRCKKSQLPLMLKLEADRMVNALIPVEEFNKEIKVIMEERRWRTRRPSAIA